MWKTATRNTVSSTERMHNWSELFELRKEIQNIHQNICALIGEIKLSYIRALADKTTSETWLAFSQEMVWKRNKLGSRKRSWSHQEAKKMKPLCRRSMEQTEPTKIPVKVCNFSIAASESTKGEESKTPETEQYIKGNKTKRLIAKEGNIPSSDILWKVKINPGLVGLSNSMNRVSRTTGSDVAIK